MSDTNIVDLTQFATGAETIKPSDGGFAEPDAGIYKYTVADLRIFNSKDNSRKFIAIDLQLDNGMRHSLITELPKVYGQETQKERDALARYKRTLVDLGVQPQDTNRVSADTIKGWTGSLRITKTPAKDSSGRVFTNVRDITPTPVGGVSHTTADAAFIPAPTAPQAPVQLAATPAQAGEATNPFA